MPDDEWVFIWPYLLSLVSKSLAEIDTKNIFGGLKAFSH